MAGAHCTCHFSYYSAVHTKDKKLQLLTIPPCLRFVVKGQARHPPGAHILSVKEDDNMPKSVPVVRCVLALAGSTLSELLEESFRLYLRRILAGSCTQR